jgi:hypothetical protein
MNRLFPNLTGVSDTMLLALHNRAVEAKRRDGVLIDPDSVRIYEAIDCDFRHRFGNSEGSLAVRVAEIDRVLRQWLECHPDGLVVSLGEGLEMQVRRVDNGPDAMAVGSTCPKRFGCGNGSFRRPIVSATLLSVRLIAAGWMRSNLRPPCSSSREGFSCTRI